MINSPASTTDASSALLIKLSARPDFSKVETMPRGPERKAAAWQAIQDTAKAAEAPFIKIAEQLKANGAITGYTTLVSPAMLIVTPAPGKGSVVAGAFRIDGVKAIYGNDRGNQSWPMTPTVAGPEPANGSWWGLDVTAGSPADTTTTPPADKPFGLGMVGAAEAWAQGADGRGLVFGSIDTGTDVTHENLPNYRGRNADGTLSNDYNWFDPTSSASPQPRDYDSHGTHTMGTAVGKHTGVAPGATWISAHGLAGSVDSLLRSLQWMQAPTKLDGSAPDPTKAPDVIGMSWWTGPNTQDLFQESMRNLRAAGIEVVKSAGNQGPKAGTITSPGQYPEVIATAAVDKDGKVADFSSRGPAPFPRGSSTPKPDFAAPGVDVLSSVPGGRYGTMSGTSMAQPHMSGAILDILSKYPQLTHDQLVKALAAGAKDAGKPGFDPEFGAGIINLPAALTAAQQILAGTTALQPAA